MNHSATDWGIVAVFATVYLGMFLGGLPRLKLDRSGVALLGAIAVIALTGLPVEDAARAVDLPTIVLLFAFMVVSAQMRLGGFYTEVTRRVGAMPLSRAGLLAGGDLGPAVVPGDIKKSMLILAVHQTDPDLSMPPRKKGAKLSDAQIASLEQWIKMGAPAPAGAGGAKLTGLSDKARSHWAFQPVREACRNRKAQVGAPARHPLDPRPLHDRGKSSPDLRREADRVRGRLRARLAWLRVSDSRPYPTGFPTRSGVACQ